MSSWGFPEKLVTCISFSIGLINKKKHIGVIIRFKFSIITPNHFPISLPLSQQQKFKKSKNSRTYIKNKPFQFLSCFLYNGRLGGFQRSWLPAFVSLLVWLTKRSTLEWLLDLTFQSSLPITFLSASHYHNSKNLKNQRIQGHVWKTNHFNFLAVSYTREDLFNCLSETHFKQVRVQLKNLHYKKDASLIYWFQVPAKSMLFLSQSFKR